MKRIRQLYFGIPVAAIAAVFPCGCSEGVEPDIEETPTAATVSGAIEGATRADKTSFVSKEDRIGVSCYGNEDGSPLTDSDPMGYFTNVPYCYINEAGGQIKGFMHPVKYRDEFAKFFGQLDDFDYDTAKPAIYYLTGGTKLFSAYYPYVDLSTDKNDGFFETKNGEILLHCGGENAFSSDKLNVMVASGAPGNKSLNNGTISFTGDHCFRHGMAKVTVTFKALGFTDADASNILGYLPDKKDTDVTEADKRPRAYLRGIYTDAKFDYKTGKVTAYGDTPGEIDFYKTDCMRDRDAIHGSAEDYYAEFVFYVPPQTCDIKIVLKTEDFAYSEDTIKKCYYETPETRVEFKAGMAYQYTVTLRPHNTSIKGEIVPWTDGGSQGMGATMETN